MEILFFFFLLYLFSVLAQKHYNKSGYKDASGHSYYETMTDPGRKGEYLTYRDLESLGEQHKLLTNIYLPKEDGTTTEIDLIMITETGIYVFESKNYGGWIFGDESSKFWTQSLKGGNKFRFYNPIWQNKKHINILQKHLGIGSEVFRSYIIFSNRCELKKMSVRSPEVKVMNRSDLISEMEQDLTSLANRLTIFEINQIYNDLSRFALADAQTKQSHIDAMSWKN